MAHDGTEGLSPDGWRPDRVSVGVLVHRARLAAARHLLAVTGKFLGLGAPAAGVRPDQVSLLPKCKAIVVLNITLICP